MSGGCGPWGDRGDRRVSAFVSRAIVVSLYGRRAMPIYEYYCPDNNRIYQFFAKTLAQGRTVPNARTIPAFR